MKVLTFHGTSLDELRAFPDTARREAGHQLDKIQNGFDPTDWKPISAVGPGVREIRLRDPSGAFRVVYVAKLADVVHVLHCFRRKPKQWRRRTSISRQAAIARS